MAYLGTDEKEQARLNELMHGKTILRVDFQGMNPDMVFVFTDGSCVKISHLGGMEIEENH